MKSKFKALFMPGTHAATCDRVVIFESSSNSKNKVQCCNLRQIVVSLFQVKNFKA